VPSRKAAELSGRITETFAAFVLRLSGYRILARRWRCSAGELDIVAFRGSNLVFVEMKYRHRQAHRYGPTIKQKRRISRAAALFVSSRQISRRFDWRFDVTLPQTDPAA
jgi:putative endonuclease